MLMLRCEQYSFVLALLIRIESIKLDYSEAMIFVSMFSYQVRVKVKEIRCGNECVLKKSVCLNAEDQEDDEEEKEDECERNSTRDYMARK